jgi:membrane-bound lytic murein transglycosylase D
MALRVPLRPSATSQSVLLAEASETSAPAAPSPSGPGKAPAGAPVRQPATAARTGAREAVAAARTDAAKPAATVHTVAPGETLWAVARRYGVAASTVAGWNGLPAGTRVQAGQKLTIRAEARTPEPVVAVASTARGPSPASAAAPGQSAAKPQKTSATPAPQQAARADAAKPIRYRVKPGESLWAISQRFGVTVAMLRRWNNLGSSHGVQAGQELNVYREEARVARAG